MQRVTADDGTWGASFYELFRDDGWHCEAPRHGDDIFLASWVILLARVDRTKINGLVIRQACYLCTPCKEEMEASLE